MARVKKTQPTSSAVHVPSPPQKKVTKGAQSIPPGVGHPEVTILKAAFEFDLSGGRSAGMVPSDFDVEQLVMGVAHEMEHTSDYKTALRIAMDHLAEFPEYYTHLDAMEAGMEAVTKAAFEGAGIDGGERSASRAGNPSPEGRDGLSLALAALTGEDSARVRIAKRDRARQIVYGVVLVPDEEDLQKDTITAEEIERTAHNYMAKSRVIGADHTKQMDACVVESYIAPCDLVFKGTLDGEQRVPAGSWVLAVRISDPKEWAKVEAGDYEGFSVGGEGLRDRVI